MKRARKGFTLVELLVVIAIIAVLLTLIMPAIRMAKKHATGALCLANLRTLTSAWISYADENDGYLVSGNLDNDWGDPEDWVHPGASITTTTGLSDHERELEGIRQGALFEYVQKVEAYNCPGDDTWTRPYPPLNLHMSPYRSYTISDGMNGGYFETYAVPKVPGITYMKLSTIKSPEDRFVFIEEEDAYVSFGDANWGTWILGGLSNWWDPIAIWHGGCTNIGFADSHAEKHQWVDQSTLDLAESQTTNQTLYPGEGTDLRYIRKAYHQDIPVNYD